MLCAITGHIVAAHAIAQVIVIKECPFVGIQDYRPILIVNAPVLVNAERHLSISDCHVKPLLHFLNAFRSLLSVLSNSLGNRNVLTGEKKRPLPRIIGFTQREIRGHQRFWRVDVACLQECRCLGIPEPKLRHFMTVFAIFIGILDIFTLRSILCRARALHLIRGLHDAFRAVARFIR